MCGEPLQLRFATGHHIAPKGEKKALRTVSNCRIRCRKCEDLCHRLDPHNGGNPDRQVFLKHRFPAQDPDLTSQGGPGIRYRKSGRNRGHHPRRIKEGIVLGA